MVKLYYKMWKVGLDLLNYNKANRNGKTYRANYDHSSKEHRCTALNGDGVSSRSAWTAKGITARSGFIPQTIINNKSYASTR